MPSTRRCAIWFVLVRRPRKINSVLGTGWGNSCLASAAVEIPRAKPGARRHWRWFDSQVFDHRAQQETFVDYKNEVEHATERVARLDKALDRAVEQAPPRMQELVLALRSLRAVATLTAMSRELAGFVWAVGRQRETEMNKEGLPVERFKEAGKHPHGKEQSSKHLCDRHGRAELAPLV